MEGGFQFSLNNIASLIILISSVIIAIKTIYTFLKKPVDDLQEKAEVKEEEHIVRVLEDKMPGLLQENCKVIMGSLEELKAMTLNQEEKLNDVQASLNLLNDAQLDMLRYNMNKLYYKYRPYKKILAADKKAFLKLYNDYKPMGGNSWIDALHAEVITWEVVEDESELSQ